MTGDQPPYKILVLIKSLGLGGAERLLVDALPYLDRQQFEYTFAYLLPWKDFLVPRFDGFPIHCLGGGNRQRQAVTLALAARNLARFQRRHRFHLVHAHLPLSGVLARLVGRRYGLPVVYTEHNLQERYHPLTRWLNRLTYGWNSRVLAVSAEVAVSMARFHIERKAPVETLLNGVPVEQVRAEAAELGSLRQQMAIPPGHRVVGTVAIFRRQKRLADWLAAAAQIAAQRPDVTFLLVGHGPEEALVKQHIERLGLQERVRLPGFRPDGRRLLGLMDVYLMSSEFEGLPVALLEAMALGKPVVATAVGGIPELVRPGVDGLLAPVGAVDRLAAHALALLAEPERRQRMSHQAARRIEENFHLKDRVRFTENLYRALLSRPVEELS